MRVRLLLLGSLTLQPTVAMAAEPPPAGSVRIYRCVAGNGAIALQDAPCDDNHRQQVLDMQRPQDPPPRPPPASSAPAATAPAEREIRIVTAQPPQPLYECIAPDGGRYTSDDGVGNPRWVPLWVGGYYPPPRVGGSVSGSASLGSGRISIEGGRPPSHGHGHRPYPGGPAVATGTWVRDTCHPLPQQEVCARLHDRRWELIRRYNSALQSERQDLTREQRGIEARLARDCAAAP